MKSMRTIILIMLATLALGAAVSAVYPVEVNITSNQAWMVADNRDTVTITATVIQGTGEFAGQPLEGANVSFAVDSPWQLKNSFLLTDKDGIATTTLLDTRKSGTANITVTAWAMINTETWGYLNYSDTKTFSQPIDHDTPWTVMTSYLNQVQVGNITRISVLVKDKNGNPVDNRNVVESVKFAASSSGVSGFLSGSSYLKSLTVPVNASGYADVQYLVYPTGTNYILIDLPSPISTRLIAIQGTAQSKPFSVISVVSPDGAPYPYTDVNTGKFTIGFTFFDQFGFPTTNQPVNITTGIPGESKSLTTNKNGMVVISYGPKDIAGKYNITAKAVNNASISVTRTVEFVSGAPADALLTASPQTMASRDVKDDIISVLTMKVIDEKGNPVEGEKVFFRFKSFSVSTKFNQTMPPILEGDVVSTSSTTPDIQAVTDENGDAVVTFHPGAFTTDITDLKYNVTATGSAVVEAQWSTVKRQVTLRYLNYRYLTVESEVHPSTVRVNETVDVTVRVRGDGWALQPKPIDVILINDRSGSMLSDYPDRAVSVMTASRVFSQQLDYSRDRLGQVSFGGKGQQTPSDNSDCGKDGDSSDDDSYALANYKGSGNYLDYATLDQILTNVPATITTKINSLTPGGYTPMRYAIYTAINGTKDKWNPNSVRALIVLSDGDYNHYGDPLARVSSKSTTSTSTGTYDDLTSTWYKFSGLSDTNQNMSNYAKSYNVKIFTIGFAQSISAGGKKNLTYLANQTGGKYYDATAANLADVYKDIAGSLRDEAGVNTSLSLSFRNISVTTNDMTNITAGNKVYDYQYIPGRSTQVDTWNTTQHFTGYPMTFNDTSQWNTNQTFRFNIGTIRLGQTWQSTVTLKVLKEGTINVLDSTSEITTQDSANPLKLMPLKIPDVFITALPNNSASNLNAAANLKITDLRLTNTGSNTSMDLAWNLSYDGMFPISEEIAIAPCGTNYWNNMGTREVSNLTQNDTISIGFEDLPVGDYVVRVRVNADDANPDEAKLSLTYDGSSVTVLPGDPDACVFGGIWPYGPGWPPGILSPGQPGGVPPKSYIKIS
jgi:Mg-chelatase subunit ChlD